LPPELDPLLAPLRLQLEIGGEANEEIVRGTNQEGTVSPFIWHQGVRASSHEGGVGAGVQQEDKV
jgi:hypothetical protein